MSSLTSGQTFAMEPPFKSASLISLFSTVSNSCIIICPECFTALIRPSLIQIDQVALRDPHKEYQHHPSTLWSEVAYAYNAQVWEASDHSQKIIYLPHTGQLFTRPDSYQASSLIVHLLQEEDLLAIPQIETEEQCAN